MAVQATSAIGLHRLVADHLKPDGTSREVKASFDAQGVAAAFTGLVKGARDKREIRARIDAMALAAPTVSQAERMRTNRARLPVNAWLRPPAAHHGGGRTDEGSCRVGPRPARRAGPRRGGQLRRARRWPPATRAGRRYIDAGVRSATNASLAQGHDVVVVLAPDTGPGLNPAPRQLADEMCRCCAHTVRSWSSRPTTPHSTPAPTRWTPPGGPPAHAQACGRDGR